MRKYLPHILIVAIIGIFIPTHFVHAQSEVLAWLGGGFDKMVGGIIYVIFLALINLFSWIVGFAGALLNFVMKYTILDMTAVIKGGVGVSTTKYSGLTGLNVSWKIIRDLMNVAFVFLLIYEGIQLILDIGSLQNIKKLIFGIVLASLLINFSLFFTEVLIDASNIVTTGIYNSIIGPVPNGKDYGQFGISDAMMQALGLSSIWGDDGKGGVFVSPSLGDGPGQILISGVGLVSIMLVSAFIFFAVSIMFIVRFLTLIFLLMLSPIAYMGLALPSMKKYADEWWESLKGQLLFAPIYMVMTLIVLKMIASPGFITGASFAEVTNHDAKVPSTGYINLILNFVVIIGLLIASLVTAKKWASMGSKHIGTATKSLTSFAGGAVFGGAARLSRNTIGRAGNALANNEKVKDMSVNGNILTRNFAKAGIATGNKAATTNLDVRGSRVFQTIAKQAGMKDEFGKAPDSKKLNFREELKAKSESEKKRMEALKPSDDAYAEAKEKDKINDKIIEEEANKAKEKLKNNAYEKDAQEHFKSEEWKNTEIGKAETEAEEVVKKYEESKKASDDLDKKILENEKKIQQIREGKIFGDENIVREEQMLMLKEQEAKKQELSKLELLKTEKSGAIEAGKKARDTYVKDLKSKLEQTRDAEKGIYEKKQNQIWEERVIKEADRFGHQEPARVTEARNKLDAGIGQNGNPLTAAEMRELENIISGKDKKLAKQQLKSGYDEEGYALTDDVRKKLESVVNAPENHDTGYNQLHRDFAASYGSILNAIGITSAPLSRGDRQRIRRSMMSAPKGKKPKDELEEMIKKFTGNDDKEKKEEPKNETPAADEGAPKPEVEK